MRSCQDERLLARSETEGTRRRGPWHPAQGGGEDLGHLYAHPGEISETEKAERGSCSEAVSRAHSFNLLNCPGEARPVEAARRERREATLERHCELWETERKVRVSVSTMSRAVRKLGWTFKKSRWEPPSGTKRREVLGGRA